MKNILAILFVLFGFQLKAQDFKYTMPKIHNGLFLSVNAGINHVDIQNDADNGNSEDESNNGRRYYRGFGPAIDVKVGAALSSKFIVHGTIIYYTMSGPDVESDDDISVSSSASIQEGMLGGGCTYYLNTSDTYLSGSVGVGGFNLDKEITGYGGMTNLGMAFQLQAGKDWYLSDKTGLGFAFSYGVCNVKDKPASSVVQKLNSNNWSIMLHFTFD